MPPEISFLKPLGYETKQTCGYCKTNEGYSSYYLSCEKMRLDHYEELMNRGWRRSGTTYYKPDLTHSCCPHYTIRLKAADFRATKEQRQTANRWNTYVLGQEYKRKAAMLCPQPREEKRQKRDKFDLKEVVHLAKYSNIKRPVGRKSGIPIEPAHRFEVTLEADVSTKEKYAVFLKYQTEIHKDPPSRWKQPAFQRFLCSGLERKTVRTNGKTQKLGSFHQCYRIDGKLVAVGVLDLLSHAVSSVYLFYDPDYEQWDFGKLSALHEIALAEEGQHEYYYMGYYIHSCIKMRYKANFSPTYVLDPESFDWNPLDQDLRSRLDHQKYLSPSGDQKRGVPLPTISQNPTSATDELELQQSLAESLHSTKARGAMVADDKEIEFDSESSEDEDSSIPGGSLFDYDIPGVLTKDEVAELDLSHWKLLVRNALIDLEDLRGWEDWKIDAPDSIKGIAAEIIAATGPKLLQHSAMDLF